MYSKLLAAFLTLLLCLGVAPGNDETTWQTRNTKTRNSSQNGLSETISTAQAAVPAQEGNSEQGVDRFPMTVPFAGQQNGADPMYLTAEESQLAALLHSELAEQDVVFSRTEFDMDDGIPEWEVEFRHGDWEYDYTVHALNGNILTFERDYEPRKTAGQVVPSAGESKPDTKPQKEVVPAPARPAEKQAQELTEAQAITAALAHVGLQKEDVRGLRAQRDRDDGITVYEIEFQHGRVEYDYDIHAETGVILNWDRDYDD